MANSYKTSSQRKGRQHLRRDYGYGTRFRGQQTQAGLNVWGAGLGILSSVASGVAWASKGIGKNIQAHEDVTAGAKELYESGIESGEIAQGTEFVDPSSDVKGWEKWFTAPDPSDTVSIGGREFNLSTVKEIGKVGEKADKMALKDFEGNKKSLFSSYGWSLQDTLDSDSGSDTSSLYDSGSSGNILPESLINPNLASVTSKNQTSDVNPWRQPDVDLSFLEPEDNTDVFDISKYDWTYND
tara:strand:+ start:775 stop:1497 length:723 start_codon:yes stop_codon:yes gene_type:complete